jgi:hypothetical protein
MENKLTKETKEQYLKAAEILYNRLYKTYYSPEHKYFENFAFYIVNSMGKTEIIDLIINNLVNGLIIHCGYTSTSIRSYHDRIIFVE